MDFFHLLLGRPWKYDRKVIYNGFKNTYTFRKDVHKIVLAPLKPTIAPTSKLEEKNSMLSKSELELVCKNPMVCKNPFELLLELAETPSTERQDQAPHKT